MLRHSCLLCVNIAVLLVKVSYFSMNLVPAHPYVQQVPARMYLDCIQLFDLALNLSTVKLSLICFYCTSSNLFSV